MVQSLPPLQVMQALKDLTLDTHTVVVSIHQPRSSVFELFDDLILLSGEWAAGRPGNNCSACPRSGLMGLLVVSLSCFRTGHLCSSDCGLRATAAFA